MDISMVLGWIGTILFVYGVWAVGKKYVNGFYANALANLCYVAQAIILNNPPLFWLSILLIILNLKGIYEWQFKGKKSNLSKERKHAEHSYVVSMMKEKNNYNELLMSVESKFSDETRHQTALRYITERENQSQLKRKT